MFKGIYISTKATKIISLIAFVLHLPTMLDYLTRVEYKVHDPLSSIIVISGASSGIGRDSAFDLATKGYYVYAGVRKNEDVKKLQSLSIEKKVKKGKIHPIILDVTKTRDISNLVNTVEKQIQSTNRTNLAAVVNNAGINYKDSIELQPIDDVRKIFETNFFGVLQMVKGFVPLFRGAESGRFVQISSVAGFITKPGMGIYSSSKFALEAISDALRRELVDYNIAVSLVQPGYVVSSIHDKVARHEKIVNDKAKIYPRLYSEASIKFDEEAVQLASTTKCTNDAIRDAIMNKYPRTRYPVANIVGIPVSLMKFMNQFIPDKVLDFVMEKNGS